MKVDLLLLLGILSTITHFPCAGGTSDIPAPNGIRIKRFCENIGGFYGCPTGKVINIVSAFYGRKSAAYCPHGDVSDTNCYASATRYAKFYAQGKNTGIAQASSAEFGDPCPGIAKYLEIRYECKSPAVTVSLSTTTTAKPPKETTTTRIRPLPPGSCGISQVAQSRVIGGQAAKHGAWPWQVAMYRKGHFQCGGSLINPNWIVTATHCVEKIKTGDLISDYYVVLGDHDRSVDESTEVKRQLQKIILHPDYNEDHTYNNDIAMLRLQRPILPTKFISPVCLPQQGQKVRVGKRCFVSGWGMTAYPSNPSIVLQQGILPVISKRDCVRRLKTSIGKKGLSISDQMLCAGQSYNPSATNTDTAVCKGDSGGPFVCQERNGKWTLQGVTSWGSARCSAKDSNSVFARVSEFRNWIDEVIKNDGLPVTIPQPPPLPGVPI